MTRPTEPFVALKTKAQQAVLMLHKTRDLLVCQRTKSINTLRGKSGEFRIVALQVSAGVQAAMGALHLEQGALPKLAHAALRGLAGQLEALGAEIEVLERRILNWHRADATPAHHHPRHWPDHGQRHGGQRAPSRSLYVLRAGAPGGC